MSHPILDLVLQRNDADAGTVREYLCKLLVLVWEDGECFDGKRPFGNSSWEDELFLPLVVAGLIEGVVDVDGYLDTCDYDQGQLVIERAIVDMCGIQK